MDNTNIIKLFNLQININLQVDARILMIKKLSKYGNSQALVIDKSILKLLKIEENTQLELTTNGKSLIITPVKSKIKEKKTNKKLDNLTKKNIKKYAPTLKKLAKN